MSRIQAFIAALWCIFGCACVARHAGVEDDAVYKAEGIAVYSDSVVLEGVTYVARSAHEIAVWPNSGGDGEGPRVMVSTWGPDGRHVDAAGNEMNGETRDAGVYPEYTSAAMMGNALWNRAIERWGNERLETHQIALGRALTDPERSMEALRDMAPKGVVERPGFPVRTAHEGWAAAAWQVYCATGDMQWLHEAYKIASASYNKMKDVMRQPGEVTVHGLPWYISEGNGGLPEWMNETDRYQCVSVSTNAWMYASLRAMALMAKELKLKAQTGWEIEAARLREAINDTFWEPAKAHYGSYTYGDYYSIPSPQCDNIANPLCVILGIATSEMATAAMSSREMTPGGMPTLNPVGNAEGGEPMAAVQLLQGLGAARTGLGELMSHAIGTLWGMALKDSSATEWPMMVMRGYFGLEMTTEGLWARPVIPESLPWPRTLKGVRYREATVDISVRGTGDRIASVMLDSAGVEHAMVPAHLKGHHTLEITMAGNSIAGDDNRGGNGAKIAAKAAIMPETPHIHWKKGKEECSIENRERGTDYNVWINGVMTECLTADRYTLRRSGTSIVAITPLRDGVEGFSPRAHVSAPEGALIHIPATAITPRRSPLHLIPQRETATKYIELAARHNTRLTFYVQAPAAGEYFLNIDYANGGTETAVRTVEVANEHAGTLVCTPVRRADWISTRKSSTLRVRLEEGVNKLSFTYVGGTILLHDINMLRKE